MPEGGHRRLAHVLALVLFGIADHQDRNARGCGKRCGALGFVSVVEVEDGFRQGGAQSLCHRDDLWSPHVARPAVPEVDRIGERSDHRDLLARTDFQREHRGSVHRLVAEEDDRLGRRLPGQRSVRRVGEHVSTWGRLAQNLGEAEPGGDHPLHRGVDLRPRGRTRVEVVDEVAGPHHPVRHLDVEATVQRTARIADPEDPVADHEARESPLVPEHVGEQCAVLPAPLTVHAVVRAHHRRDPFVDDTAEVREKDLVQCDLVHGDVDRETSVLHRVAGEMLHTGHRVLLNPPGECGTHLTDVVGVLAVGLLCSSPGGVTQQVHAHPSVEVGADRAQLRADRLADPLLEIGVPAGTAGHADREAGRPVDHHPAWAVGEREAREPEALDRSRPERALVVAGLGQVAQSGPEGSVTVEAPQLFLWGHLRHDGPGPPAGFVPRGLCRQGASLVKREDSTRRGSPRSLRRACRGAIR